MLPHGMGEGYSRSLESLRLGPYKPQSCIHTMSSTAAQLASGHVASSTWPCALAVFFGRRPKVVLMKYMHNILRTVAWRNGSR